MILRGGDALATYLNDHLAGSTAGLDLARRIADANPGTEYGEVVGPLAGEIAEDRRALEDVMGRLGADRDELKLIAAWGAEQLRRLRPGWLLGESGTGRLEELEMLGLGVTGKLALWEALQRTHAADPRLGGVDLQRLTDRARSQLERIEGLRLDAAAEAFGQA
jgi:hypothetical protein